MNFSLKKTKMQKRNKTSASLDLSCQGFV